MLLDIGEGERGCPFLLWGWPFLLGGWLSFLPPWPTFEFNPESLPSKSHFKLKINMLLLLTSAKVNSGIARSQDGASPHCRSGQALGGGPPGARSSSLQGQIQSPHRRHGQAQAGPFAAVAGARDRRLRHSPQRGGRPTAGKAAAGARRQGAAGEGSEANEARQAAAKGRGTHSQSDSRWLECGGALGL